MPTNPNQVFRSLHEQSGAFVIPNPWDVGSARILAGMGFKALATTSGGMAYSLGKPDGQVSREQALRHCSEIVAATELPVSADLENGFGDTPESVFQTIADAGALFLGRDFPGEFAGHSREFRDHGFDLEQRLSEASLKGPYGIHFLVRIHADQIQIKLVRDLVNQWAGNGIRDDGNNTDFAPCLGSKRLQLCLQVCWIWTEDRKCN